MDSRIIDWGVPAALTFFAAICFVLLATAQVEPPSGLSLVPFWEWR